MSYVVRKFDFEKLSFDLALRVQYHDSWCVLSRTVKISLSFTSGTKIHLNSAHGCDWKSTKTEIFILSYLFGFFYSDSNPFQWILLQSSLWCMWVLWVFVHILHPERKVYASFWLSFCHLGEYKIVFLSHSFEQ